MGINCCKETQKEDPNVLAKGEQEIDFAEYTSSNDKLVQKIEQNYNLLTHLQLYYYLNHILIHQNKVLFLHVYILLLITVISALKLTPSVRFPS